MYRLNGKNEEDISYCFCKNTDREAFFPKKVSYLSWILKVGLMDGNADGRFEGLWLGLNVGVERVGAEKKKTQN